ncbi:krab-a domain-containing protein [Lasius niger]|uniref:Krab-a domain-containing protein n=1 Tax=Lasius niger TaxID=67767 RepID=A0A0J7K6V7_LASNI|nr:krab-a domain-containing protein [Lasius niger]
MVSLLRKRIPVSDCKLRYPTGEEVNVKFKVNVWIELRKFSLEFPMLVTDINDDCLLGIDFFRVLNLEKVLDPVLGILGQKEFQIFTCSRLENLEEKVPQILNELFEENSRNLNFSQRKVFADFLSEFYDIFSGDVAGSCKLVEHEINLNNSCAIKQTPRWISIFMREEVNKIIEEMKEKGVIEESQSSWVSPAILVKKKDGSIRFCVDYRKLNAVTVKDSYPLPRIDEILDQLSGNSWFSTLDLKSGYWQIKICQKDKAKTAFLIGNGLWQFTVVPFGLCNAPATFARLMERVLYKLSKICLVYLDDVIIFGKSFEEMIKNLRKIFLRLRAANLKINPKNV